MRFLFYATVGAPKSLITDGSTILLLSILKDLSDSGKHFCYVLFPSGCDINNLPKLPRVMYLTTEIDARNLDAQKTCVDQVLINNFFGINGTGKYVVDAGVVMHPTQVLPMKQALGFVGAEVDIPVFVIEQGTDWYTSSPNYNERHILERWGALGACFSNMIVMSHFDAKNWVAKVHANDLTPNQKAQFERNLRIASAPINMEAIKSVQSIAHDKYSVPTYLWAARTNATKNPKAVLDIIDSLYRQGENLQVKYLSQTSALKGDLVAKKMRLFEEREYITPVFSATQEDFYREAAKSHLFICWSYSESYNASAVEASLLGCVFMCVDKPQFRDLYPFGLGDERFWLTKENAEERIRWVLRNYEEAYAMQEPLRAEFIKQQTERRIALVLENAMMDYFAKPKSQSVFNINLNKGLGAILSDVVHGMPDVFTLHDVLASLAASAENFDLDNVARYTSRKLPVNWTLHNLLIRFLGVEDLCDGRFPKYRKVKHEQG